MKIIFTLMVAVFVFTTNAQNFDWTPQNSGVTVLLNDVYFADNQTGWAVGDDGVIVHTVDGGQNWTSQTSGTSEKLRAVFFIDANTGWAVGGSLNKTMIKTTNGGSNWQNIATNNIPNKIMYDIAFADANSGWTVSYDSIYITSDGGNTWINENYGGGIIAQNPRVIAVTSDTTAYVGGSKFRSVTSREAVVFYRNTDDTPLVWNISPFNPSTTDDEITSIDFTNSNIGYAGGKKGKLFKKSGTQFLDPWNVNLDISSTGAAFIWSISFPNDNNGMFNTSISILSTAYTLVYHTSNSGDTWSAAPDSIQDFSSAALFAPDTANAWAVGVGGKIYKGVRSSLGINQLSLNIDVSIYPNPSTDMINVEINSESNELISYSLSDMTGRIIEKGEWGLKSSNSRFTLNLSNVMKGVYLLKLSTDEGQSTFRVVKN